MLRQFRTFRNILNTRRYAQTTRSFQTATRAVNVVHHPCPNLVSHWKGVNSRALCSSFTGAPQQESGTTLSESEYEEISEETLDSLTEVFEDIGDQGIASSEYDVQFASGVLTITLGGGHGTYVINKQTPNKQIWLSSPTSGPKRYDYRDGKWCYKYESDSLHALLSKEISLVLNTDIDFTECSHGGKS